MKDCKNCAVTNGYKPSETIHNISEPKRDYLSELGLKLYEKDGVWLVNDSDCEEREATLTERVLWKALMESDGKLTVSKTQADNAARYCWLREKRSREELDIVLHDEGVYLDDAIDAARAHGIGVNDD